MAENLEEFIPIALAANDLQSFEIFGTHYKGDEAQPIHKLLQENGFERGCGRPGHDRLGTGEDAAQALEGELLQGGGVLEECVNGVGAQSARAAGEFLQGSAIGSKSGNTHIRELESAGEFDAGEVPAADRDQNQGVVVDSGDFPVAPERELLHRVESSEERREKRENFILSIERQAVAALTLHPKPPLADQGAVLPVAGVKESENGGQAFVGKRKGEIEQTLIDLVRGGKGKGQRGTESGGLRARRPLLEVIEGQRSPGGGIKLTHHRKRGISAGN